MIAVFEFAVLEVVDGRVTEFDPKGLGLTKEGIDRATKTRNKVTYTQFPFSTVVLAEARVIEGELDAPQVTLSFYLDSRAPVHTEKVGHKTVAWTSPARRVIS